MKNRLEEYFKNLEKVRKAKWTEWQCSDCKKARREPNTFKTQVPPGWCPFCGVKFDEQEPSA